ncbi:MAG TPA: GNAT family N-acetyltransferase [Ktedonobacterales bacterium]|nr:GNAT family N-acetyltransferase [Ktedonobacterales bacterium]
MDVLESQRLRLRPAEPDDLPNLLAAYLSYPDLVAQNEGSRGEAGYYDLAMMQRDWQIAQITPGRHTLAIDLKATGKTVGMADFLEEKSDDGFPWLGQILIHRASAGQGLGAETYQRLEKYFRQEYGWQRLRASVRTSNMQGLAFLRRMGFELILPEQEPDAEFVILEQQL